MLAEPLKGNAVADVPLVDVPESRKKGISTEETRRRNRRGRRGRGKARGEQMRDAVADALPESEGEADEPVDPWPFGSSVEEVVPETRHKRRRRGSRGQANGEQMRDGVAEGLLESEGEADELVDPPQWRIESFLDEFTGTRSLPHTMSSEAVKVLKIRAKKAANQDKKTRDVAIEFEGSEVKIVGVPAHARKIMKRVDYLIARSESEASANNVPGPEDLELRAPLLFVGNLPYDVAEDEVRQHFEGVGTVESVERIANKKGEFHFAKVRFSEAQHVRDAIMRLNSVELNGRQLRLDWCKD